MKRNCPNCGAPSEGQFCRYCDTPLYDSVDVVKNARGKKCHVWYEDDGNVYMFDVEMHIMQVDYETTPTIFSTVDPVISIIENRNVTFSGSLTDFTYDDWKEFLEWRNRDMR